MRTTAPPAEQLTEELLVFLAYLQKTTQGGVFQAATELELTLSQLRALFVLDNYDSPPALSEMAHAVGLSVAATGRAVDGLVRAGLVSRREDEADRRIKRIALTERGQAMLAQINESRRAGLRRFVDVLDDTAREHLSRALHHLPSGLGCTPPETSA